MKRIITSCIALLIILILASCTDPNVSQSEFDLLFSDCPDVNVTDETLTSIAKKRGQTREEFVTDFMRLVVDSLGTIPAEEKTVIDKKTGTADNMNITIWGVIERKTSSVNPTPADANPYCRLIVRYSDNNYQNLVFGLQTFIYPNNEIVVFITHSSRFDVTI